MAKYNQGQFIPTHPEKIVGNSHITYRSSWELTVMTLLDNHPSVISWASESIIIQYKNPLTNKMARYIPDFLVIYQDKNGNRRGEVLEVKPKKEAIAENAKSKRDRAALLVNSAKWAAAMAFCKKNGLVFKILTEDQIYITKGSQIKKKRTK